MQSNENTQLSRHSNFPDIYSLTQSEAVCKIELSYSTIERPRHTTPVLALKERSGNTACEGMSVLINRIAMISSAKL